MSSGQATTGAPALAEMRRRRTRHRLGALDWFEVAYRVYLFGIFGGGTVLWISSSVNDATVAAGALTDVSRRGPAVLGLLAALAVSAGLRGGSHGGPLALEAADVTHVMLAPIDRRHALMRPAVQRVRSALSAGVGVGAVAGQLAGRRLPGSLVAWAAGGALYGATVAMLWVGAALVAHTTRLPRWLATAAGLAVVAWQGAAVAWRIPGPADTAGSLGLWGWRQHPVDLAATVVAAAAAGAGILMLGRISVDALARRSSLVAQLRFAVTMQDLRTVILLRRQLNQEHTRHRPWLRFGGGGAQRMGFTHSLWRRGWFGLLRFPLPRILRMTALAVTFGLLQAAAAKGTTPALVGAALAAFVLGLEVMEPLSQEVDQADRADGLPVERGELLMRHLAAPAVALAPFAVIAGLAAVVSLGADYLAATAILAYPTVLAGAAGAVVSIVRDAPDPYSPVNQQAFVPPEMAGFTTTLRLVWPIFVSTLGVCAVLLPRAASRAGDSVEGASVRGAVGEVLFIVAVAWWVRLRDRVRRSVRAFMAEGRSYTAAQRRQTSGRTT